MDKDLCKGQVIIIYLVNDEHYYEGKFYSMNQDKTKISIINAVEHPKGEQVSGIVTFYSNEIKEIQLMDPEDGLEAVLNSKGRTLAHHKGPSHAHLSRMSGQTTKPAPEQDNAGNENWRSNAKYSIYVPKIDTYTIIDKIDANYHNAVNDLNTCNVVGLALEGVLLGRHGTLCWINVATGRHTYLFDMLTLGTAAFDKGLRDVLQSEKVKKVMHDCRMAADYLVHKHNIKLANIMDTQVLELLVKRIQQDKYPYFVSSLHHCIVDYLHVPTPVLTFPVIREDFIEYDLNKWAERPMAAKVLELAVSNVVFLEELRRALLDALLQPAFQGTQIYLNHVTSMVDEDADMYYGCIHMTPRQIFSMSRKRREEERGMQRLNPRIRFSRDVMHYFEDASDSEEDSGVQKSNQDNNPNAETVNALAAQLTGSNINQ